MLIDRCGEILTRESGAAKIQAPESTPLGALAGTVRGMAMAYADDGATFAGCGDRVNVLAAYYYGFGWLHFGCAYGLLALPDENPACPFTEGETECLAPDLSARLDEKAHRYARLLRAACASVSVAPEPETAGGEFAGRVLAIGTCYLRAGEASLCSGRKEEALARCSYGHGWLDAGVRAGLFAVSGNREIFTI